MKFDFDDIVGKKIGCLTVLRYLGKRPSRKYWLADWSNLRLHSFYVVKCKCGEKRIVSRISLLKKKEVKKHLCCRRKEPSVSCKTHKNWLSMNEKCDSKRQTYYSDKNIKVCERWHKFKNFLKDMGKNPRDKVLIRKDKTKNWSKSNCKWGTRKESSSLSKRTNIISINGEKKSLREWFSHFQVGKYKYSNYYKRKDKSLRKIFGLTEEDSIKVKNHSGTFLDVDFIVPRKKQK